MSEEGHLTTETLVAVILLMVFVVCGPIFEKIHFHYMHESGVVMLLGVLAALFINLINPHVSLIFNTYNHHHRLVSLKTSDLIQKYFLL